MKKNFYIAAALLASSFFATNALAVDLVQSNPGDNAVFTPTATGVPGATALDFSPSNNVVMDGTSEETGFLINGYHTAALGKAAGQAYGMTADSNTIWFLVIEEEADATAIQVAGTNSGDLTGYTKI